MLINSNSPPLHVARTGSEHVIGGIFAEAGGNSFIMPGIGKRNDMISTYAGREERAWVGKRLIRKLL